MPAPDPLLAPHLLDQHLLDPHLLADAVHAVRVADGLVFLDIARDAYFCLYAPLLADPRAAQEQIAEMQHLAQAHGLLRRDPAIASQSPAPPSERAWREAAPAPAPRATLRDVVALLRGVLRTAWRFQRCSFADLIADAQSAPTACLPAGTRAGPTAAALVATFDRLCLWLPFRFQCLFRAVLLRELLRARGARVDWVFGVALFPFQAHCWLAEGDLLLGERLDSIKAFTTILVVRQTAP